MPVAAKYAPILIVLGVGYRDIAADSMIDAGINHGFFVFGCFSYAGKLVFSAL
jgi:hypothetical protein